MLHMKCVECEDWPHNIDKLNAPFVLAAARSGNPYQYVGKPFEFCPWCGRRLIEDDGDKLPPNDMVSGGGTPSA